MTFTSEGIEKLLKAGRRRSYWRRGNDLARHARQIFGQVRLQGQHVLEIGAGRGVFSIWAGLEGACRVVALEPMASGFYDSSNFLTEFRKIVTEVGLSNVEMQTDFIQDYPAPDYKFDVVLSVASINHLNEDACVRIRKDAAAQLVYLDVFRRIHSLMTKGGTFILIDASSHTLLSDIGLKNPFAPVVEWEKHQPAHIWAGLLSRAGFENTSIRYNANRFARYLQIQYVPHLVSYCTDGLFRIETTAA